MSVAALCLMLISQGCNNDVFLDEPDMPEQTSVTLEGDGGEASYIISKKGLEHISLDLFSENERYCTYYNRQGEKVDSKVAASDLGTIVFETNFTLIKIVKDGNRLTIRSLCNASSMEDHYGIRLEYDYGVRFINIVILPGLPLKITDINYDSQLHVIDDGRTVTSRSSYTNDTSMPWDIQLRPYIQAYATTLVEPVQTWAKDGELTMKVPVYADGEWTLAERDGIRLGVAAKYDLPLSQQMITEPIMVPAN